MFVAPRSPLLLHVFPTFGTGGAQVRFAAVVNRFGSRWRHAIVAMDGDISCRERLAPDLDVLFPRIVLPKNDTLRNTFGCYSALRSLAPQSLVTTNWGALEWAMAAKLPPVVRHVHIEDGLGLDEAVRQFARRVWTRRLLLRRSTAVVPTRGLERMAVEVWRLPPRRVHMIPNGVDLTRFDVSAQRMQRPLVIGTVAALRVEKNLGRLLKAFRIVRRNLAAKLVIVGDGSERSALKFLAVELGVAADVRFIGHLAWPEIEYANFDVFALSSDTEQMPFSVLEAMAARLPVVTTDVGDVRLMLAPENEKFVVVKEAVALAAALIELLNEPELRRSIGAANRARVEQSYDQQVMFNAWAEVFDAAASSGFRE